MTTEHLTATAEAMIDTFDALTRSPRFSDPTVLKELNSSYMYLEELTKGENVPDGQPNGIPAQAFLNDISEGVQLVLDASDHRMLVSGATPRELKCDTCGKLISHHDRTGSYTKLGNAVSNIETIFAVRIASEKAAAKAGRRA